MEKKILYIFLAIVAISGAKWFDQNKYLLNSAKNSTPVEQPGDSVLTKLVRPSKPAEGKLTSIRLPKGFSISYFAKECLAPGRLQ